MEPFVLMVAYQLPYQAVYWVVWNFREEVHGVVVSMVHEDGERKVERKDELAAKAKVKKSMVDVAGKVLSVSVWGRRHPDFCSCGEAHDLPKHGIGERSIQPTHVKLIATMPYRELWVDLVRGVIDELRWTDYRAIYEGRFDGIDEEEEAEKTKEGMVGAAAAALLRF
uniref:Uncharacterized protein n=1 Tax=Cannabis sativa TaxID=3483 RepID=A0A803PMN0_CANSA